MALRREAVDPARRIRELANRQAPQIAKAFISAIEGMRNQRTLKELADLLEQGKFEEALAMVEAAGKLIAGSYGNAMVQAGQEAAAFLSAGVLQAVVAFDQTNWRAVQAMQANTLRLVENFSAQQRAVTRLALEQGIRDGINPREMARTFRDSIGLTESQDKAVRNFRRMLQEGRFSEAKTRRLRDARSDPTLNVAMRDKKALTQKQIDNMVDRYRTRYIAHRAQVIGRTEALRSAHEGTELMYQQAIDSGQVDPSELVREWVATKDKRTRDTHRHLDGVEKPFGETWVSGGATIRFPGDPLAPASETVQCRCVLTTRMYPGGKTGA